MHRQNHLIVNENATTSRPPCDSTQSRLFRWRIPLSLVGLSPQDSDQPVKKNLFFVLLLFKLVLMLPVCPNASRCVPYVGEEAVNPRVRSYTAICIRRPRCSTFVNCREFPSSITAQFSRCCARSLNMATSSHI
jgi:hypothetical protein